MDIMESKNIEFKDLERLTSSELYEELTTVFGDFSFAKIKNAKTYYEFFKRRTSEGKPALIVYRVKDAIFNLLKDEEVSIRNIEILSSISKLLEMTRGSTECDENYVYDVFKFCKKYGLESYHDIKDLILGYGYYNMYFKSNTESYIKYDLLDFLTTINSKDEVKKLVACCKEFSNISNIFRYELQKRYPNNTAGLFATIKHCFGSIRKHFDLDNDDTEDKFVISEQPTTLVRQGDILIWSEKTEEYKENFPTVKNLQTTTRMALQDGDSITGDHELVPLKGAKFTLQTGKFIPPLLKEHFWGDNAYDCKILEID